MPSQFINLAITVRDRPLYDAVGGPVRPYPLEVGQVIRHWCDPDLTAAWFAYANTLLNDPSGLGANNGQVSAGLLSMALDAICNGFNAANIVWWNQPTARAIYRKWLSGPPMSINGRWQAFVFGPDVNYGGSFADGGTSGWFEEREDMPVTHSSPVPGGILPRLARLIFNRYYWPGVPDAGARHPTQFIPAIGFTLKPASGTSGNLAPAFGDFSVDARPLMVELMNEVQNTYWMMSAGNACDPEVAFPRLCDLKDSRGNYWVDTAGITHGPAVFSADWVGYDDMTDFRFAKAAGELVRDMELPAAPAPMEFIPYLRELAAAMAAMSPVDLIQDSRAFVVYQNYSYVRESHTGLSGYLNAVFGTAPDQFARWTTPNPLMETAATTAYSIGGALAVQTYGISAIVGGAVGAGLQIANRVIRHPGTAHKDDLGRLKPCYERAWLSGDQDPNDAAAGAPYVVLREPPGYVRIPFAQDLNGLLAAMNLSCSEYLALTRAQRFEHVGVAAFQDGHGPYVVPTDTAQASLLGRLVDALNAHCVRIGFAGPPDLNRPSNGVPCPGCNYDATPPSDASVFWGRLGVGLAFVWSAWKILVSK